VTAGGPSQGGRPIPGGEAHPRGGGPSKGGRPIPGREAHPREGGPSHGGRPIPEGERRRIVARAVFARAYHLEKWDLRSKAGVKIKPSHFRRDCG